ncbi:histidine phosphotransferase family protein [Amorphus sp. 3PC139-8]|uniref:histidine phosphotransferase family protein n=1 Tax=Amorphus sp. 3PC139-8 TaxID=2735676 RepID=UPI00345C762E
MSNDEILGSVDLASLLASRICHDVVGPVGAITNGLELLESDDSEETRELAMQLVEKSARQASAALQLMRLAYGAGGSAGSMIDLADATKLLTHHFEHERADLEIELPIAVAPRSAVKVLLNLALFAVRAIPRGGLIRVAAEMDGERMKIRVDAEGINARIPDTTGLLTGETDEGPIDPHSIQPYLTRLLLREADMKATAALDGERFTLTAA